MKLKDFAEINLNLSSRSTNPSHKRFLAFAELDNLSYRLTQEQYDSCKEYIGNDFNPEFLIDSEVDLLPPMIDLHTFPDIEEAERDQAWGLGRKH